MDSATLLQIIDLAVAWVPTILFVLIILISGLRGFRRGFRKSLILLVHSLIVGGLCISLYFILVNTVIGDQLLLELINTILGKEGAIQNQLGVDTSIDRLTLVLVELIKNNHGLGEGINIIIQDNGNYLAVLVNLVYHIVFAIVLYIVYLLLLFVLYLVYLIFYSDKKHAKRVMKKFQNYQADSTFKKRRLFGALLGMGRGLLSALLCVSMLGGVFYIASGGNGNGELEDKDFGNDSINMGYQIYQEVESYGTTGIIQVLNVVQDEKQVPYYLYLADLIFQGNYTDESIDNMVEQTESLVLRQELATYTSFVKDALKLVLKYKEEEILLFINGELSQEDLMNQLTLLFAEDQFQFEFTKLINSFDDNTYFFNLALSLVDTVVSNVDNPNFDLGLEDEAKEVIQLLLADNYYCDAIPEEQLMVEMGYEYDLPHLKPSNLLTKSDVNVLLAMLFTMMEIDSSNNLYMIESIIAFAKELSIFESNRKDEVNPVLARLYKYLEHKYLSDSFVLTEGMSTLAVQTEEEKAKEKQIKTYISTIENTNVDWIGEVDILLDLSSEIVVLTQEFAAGGEEGLDILVSMFDPNNPKYEENHALYVKLKDALVDSKILSNVLSTKAITGLIIEAVSQIAPGFQMPEKVNYANEYDAEGNLVKTGELYNVLTCLETLVTSGKLDFLIEAIESGVNGYEDISELLEVLNSPDENGYSAVDYVFESQVFTSVISAALVELSYLEGSFIFVPEEAKLIGESGARLNIIDPVYLKELLVSLPDILVELKPLLDGESINITELLNSEAFTAVADNPIVKGIIINQMVILLAGNEVIIIPEKLKDVNAWFVGTEDEFDLLLNAIKTLSIDFNNLDTDVILNTFRQLSKENIEDIFESSVFHYTISNLILNGAFQDLLVIPNSSKQFLLGDTLDAIIDKPQLVVLTNAFKTLLDIDFNNIQPTELINVIIEHKEELLESDIVKATIVSILYQTINTVVAVPDDLVYYAQPDSLMNYNSNNAWDAEIPALLDALDEVFGISLGQEFDLEDDLEGKIYNVLLHYGDDSSVKPTTRLSVILQSKIISYNLTVVLDAILTDAMIAPEVKQLAKDNGSYREDEIKSLCDILKMYDLIDEDGFGSFNLSELEIKQELIDKFKKNDNLYIVRGVLTKQVSNIITDGDAIGLKYHPDAYDSTYAQVLKHSEIISILEITKEIGFTTDSFIGANINYKKYLKYISNKGVCNSYILVATISNYIVSQSDALGLTIPSIAMYKGKSNIIEHNELYNLLYNLTTILDFDSLSGISTVLTGLTLKEHLFDSYILNATIVKMLISNNSFGLYGPDKEIIEDYNAVDGSKVYYLTRVGAENLVTAVTRGIGNLSLEIGNMNYNGITNMERDKLAYLLESGIIRIAISDILVEKIDSLGSSSSTYIYNYLSTVKSISLRNEDVYDLTDSNGGLRKRKTFTKSDIIAVIEVLKQYM